MVKVYLSLGSNVQPVRNLRLGVRELSRRYAPLQLSPVYRNQAVGFVGAEFLNLAACCEVDTDLASLNGEIERIHELAGRRRGRNRNADRSLDIDVLLYGREVLTTAGVTLPRPDILKYSFVLKPLADVAPAETHPQTGLSFAEHWAAWRGDDHELTPVDVDLGR